MYQETKPDTPWDLLDTVMLGTDVLMTWMHIATPALHQQIPQVWSKTCAALMLLHHSDILDLAQHWLLQNLSSYFQSRTDTRRLRSDHIRLHRCSCRPGSQSHVAAPFLWQLKHAMLIWMATNTRWMRQNCFLYSWITVFSDTNRFVPSQASPGKDMEEHKTNPNMAEYQPKCSRTKSFSICTGMIHEWRWRRYWKSLRVLQLSLPVRGSKEWLKLCEESVGNIFTLCHPANIL